MSLIRKSIQQLPQQLANQIAAGEVVERPASVIKELLENSLDAGATQIEIEIIAGGSQLIRIRDNGVGIPQDELSLALSPHATSKIRSLDDLIHVSSMGFRGEALASIASVSELVLTSCAINANDMAWSIKAKEGEFELSPASHPQGTTLEIHHLFYNTPVRRKFLKANRTEFKHIEDVVKRIALARFDVAIKFTHNQRQVFSLPVATSEENKHARLSSLINKEFLQSAIKLKFENTEIKLTGWIANADYSRSQSDMQYFFVNGRMIKDKVITHAVRQAFQETLYPGRFPVYVLQLEMDAEQVDVNVHPTKHEVRFRQSRLIHDFLFYSIREALNTNADSVIHEPLSNHHAANNYLSSNYSSFQSSNVAESSLKYPTQATQPPNIINTKELNTPLGVALSKVNNDFLLAQNQQGLLVVKLNVAREALAEKQIKEALSEQSQLISKPVLIPFNIGIKFNAQSWLDKNKSDLLQLGFNFAALGEQEIMVRQVPAMLNVSDLKHSINEFINVVSDDAVSFTNALVSIIVKDEFSHQLLDWNKLLRDLENSGLEHLSGLYHQISNKDLAGLFK
ncbi:MAG: DNA mismatch repair endonuclease MutL [Woeseiaceae bacterium]